MDKLQAEKRKRHMEIAEGGIDQREQAEFNRITAELRELVRPCLELDVFWRDAGATKD